MNQLIYVIVVCQFGYCSSPRNGLKTYDATTCAQMVNNMNNALAAEMAKEKHPITYKCWEY